MAYLLQKIGLPGRLAVVLAAVPTIPVHAEFSHRVHLAQRLDCVVCHSKAPSSTRSTDNLLPSAEVCQSCHTGEEGRPARLTNRPQIKQPREAAVAKFNHQFHTKMGNIAALIARAIDNKTYLSAPGGTRKYLNTNNICVGCHRGLEESDAVTAEAYPRMADCLVCHNKVDPPFSCTKCHTEEARLKPASHTPDWIDVHSAGKVKDKTTCAVCHGRSFTCLGCH